MTGCSTFGLLKRQGDCSLIPCAPDFAQSLLDARCPVLLALAQHVKFEVAIGCNGLVWARSGSAVDTVVIANAIDNAQHLDPAAVPGMVDKLFAVVSARQTLARHDA